MNQKKQQLVQDITKINKFISMLDNMDEHSRPQNINKNAKYRNTTTTTIKR